MIRFNRSGFWFAWRFLPAMAVVAALSTSTARAQAFVTQSWSSGVAPGVPIGKQCLSGDFNGDGLLDIACYTLSGGRWALALSTGSSFLSQVWSSGPSPNPSDAVDQQCIVGDFNADGRTDIACLSGTGGAWSVALAANSGFDLRSWGGGTAVSPPVGESCVSGDFDGDGRTDLGCYSGSGGSWNMRLSTGDGFSAQLWSSGVAPSSSVDSLCVPGDFDGNGLTDIACYSGSGGNWSLAISKGSRFDTQVRSSSLTPGSPIGAKCVTGDFNGDGLTDLACYAGPNGVWAVGLSSSALFNTQFWSSGVAPNNPVSQQCATGDSNGDGLTDVFCYTGQSGGWKVGFFTGNGIVTQSWSGGVAPGVPISNQCVTGELNGDGATDIACYSGNGGGWTVGMASPGAQ